MRGLWPLRRGQLGKRNHGCLRSQLTFRNCKPLASVSPSVKGGPGHVLGAPPHPEWVWPWKRALPWMVLGHQPRCLLLLSSWKRRKWPEQTWVDTRGPSSPLHPSYCNLVLLVTPNPSLLKSTLGAFFSKLTCFIWGNYRVKTWHQALLSAAGRRRGIRTQAPQGLWGVHACGSTPSSGSVHPQVSTRRWQDPHTSSNTMVLWGWTALGSVVSVLATMVHTGQWGVRADFTRPWATIVRTRRGGAPLLLLSDLGSGLGLAPQSRLLRQPHCPCSSWARPCTGPYQWLQCHSGSNICIPLPQSPP